MHKEYTERRKRLAEAMGKGIAVLRTAPERVRNRDAHHPYRFDSYFYYLSRFTEPDAVLVITTDPAPRTILLCRDKDIEREIWDGFRYGPDGARETFEVDEAHSITQADQLLPQLLENQPAVYYEVGGDPAWDSRVIGWLNGVRAKARSGVTAPAEIHDIRSILDEMRLIKDASEIETMKKAAGISARAHIRAMQATKPGMKEYEVEAELLHEFRRSGAQSPAYTSIVAGGPNACILHYVDNNATLKDGDLLLIDAGCELNGYASDITRTFPVSGKFSGPQRDIYELVLAAQAAAIEQVKPGNEWEDPHRAALNILAQGFVDLGLCRGTRDSVIESGDYKKFYMHRTGHWLGMDVHDVGDYKRGGVWRTLRPGMVLTVEPGCYVRADEGVPERFWDIGVRIEDDAVVTQEGRDIITRDVPKEIAEIETLMAG
ncbi:MAG: aminopeptidase P N-terminal domain-containing protein [Betaproteobacteria bacterium]|nr:MAG: aminopeptidase P N-terminal domain-containing protein [Betaproteobacteria bacterium]